MWVDNILDLSLRLYFQLCWVRCIKYQPVMKLFKSCCCWLCILLLFALLLPILNPVSCYHPSCSISLIHRRVSVYTLNGTGLEHNSVTCLLKTSLLASLIHPPGFGCGHSVSVNHPHAALFQHTLLYFIMCFVLCLENHHDLHF